MTRTGFSIGSFLASAIGGIALFFVIGTVALRVPFQSAAGFDPGTNIVAGIGYVLFNIFPSSVPATTEGFLAHFLIIGVVLVAALVGAVMLARREVGGEMIGTPQRGDES